VALGANLGDRRATLDRAGRADRRGGGQGGRPLGWIETPALIHPDDPATDYPAFLNGVVLASTGAPAGGGAGAAAWHRGAARARPAAETARWRPRAVDLDLIALDDLVVERADLRLPHPAMHERRFVLGPMAEVWAGWRHPVLGRTVAEMLAGLGE
jgi:2-amino-4-hydroxy-6-hydroxymethyldihydropteridine diphosphokinase